jgi:hypothetical protein
MDGDQHATVAALDAARGVFRQQIEAHRGRLVDTAGDSVLPRAISTCGAATALRQPFPRGECREWVACRCTRSAVDGQQCDAHRKFEARRPECAVQRSAASVRWAVLVGHKQALVNGGCMASQSGRTKPAGAFGRGPPWGNQIQPVIAFRSCLT